MPSGSIRREIPGYIEDRQGRPEDHAERPDGRLHAQEDQTPAAARRDDRTIHFLICGGELGPQHRPMDIAWVESIVKQCVMAQVPAFVKQASALRDGQQGRLSDELWTHDWTPGEPLPREMCDRLSV